MQNRSWHPYSHSEQPIRAAKLSKPSQVFIILCFTLVEPHLTSISHSKNKMLCNLSCLTAVLASLSHSVSYITFLSSEWSIEVIWEWSHLRSLVYCHVHVLMIMPSVPKKFLCLVRCRLKTTVFTRPVFTLCESSYFNLKFGIKQSKIG